MSAPQPFKRRHQHYQALMPSEPDLWAVARNERCAYADFVERSILPPSEPIDTSEAAADAIRPIAPSIREAIFALIQEAGERGMTAGELEARSPYSGSTIRPRLRELEGTAPWAKGQLPVRIIKTAERRAGMRVYRLTR